MYLIKECIASIKRRPFIFSFFLIFSVIASYIEQLLYSLYKRYLSSSVKDFLDKFNIFDEHEPSKILPSGSEIEEITSGLSIPPSKILPLTIVIILGLFALSAILSFIVSGYTHVLNISLTNKERASNEFINGVIKHYFKYLIYIFLLLLLTILFAVTVFLAILPTIFCLKLIIQGGYSDLILATIFIAIITVLAVFFSSIIYTMYTTFLFPALTNYRKGAFYMARKVVNANFGYLVPRILVYNIIFIAWNIFLFVVEYGTLTFPATMSIVVLNTMFKITVGFIYVFFIYYSFKRFKEELQNASI